MAYSIKGKPFVFKGTVNVTECKSSVEVMEKAGLNWEVAKCRVFAEMPATEQDIFKDNNSFIYGADIYYPIDNQFATYRTDKNIPLGLVKKQYTPVQNVEAFKFFDDAIGTNRAIYQTAGCFGYGERIFVSAKLPDDIIVNGDPVESYLVFTTSHDGTSGVKILFTPIRVVCENTLNAAINNASSYVSFRHSKSVHYNIDIASEILGICKEKQTFVSEQYNIMAKLPVKDEDANMLLAKVIFTQAELDKLFLTNGTLNQVLSRNYMTIKNSELSTQKVNNFNTLVDYYHTGIGQKEIEGTQWGVYNAVTGYYSNVFNAETYKRMDSLLYGYAANKIEQISNLMKAA